MCESEHGCAHYRRRCKLWAPCCEEFFWCRHCHNDSKYSQEQVQHRRHTLDRHSVTEVLCVVCDTRQPVSKACTSCKVAFGAYSCLECNLFDDDTTKQQYHCALCGICRVGGVDNFFHCATCGCCFSKNLQANHLCLEDTLKQPCPVCSEFLFDSTRPISVLPGCGHTLHKDCQLLLDKAKIPRCPLCLRSAADMQATKVIVASAVQLCPSLPQEGRDSVVLDCCDCHHRTKSLFHAFGQQCSDCGSFNTRILNTL